MPFVLDASVTLAWAFEDESTPYTDAVQQALRHDQARVPAIWWLEVWRSACAGACPSSLGTHQQPSADQHENQPQYREGGMAGHTRAVDDVEPLADPYQPDDDRNRADCRFQPGHLRSSFRSGPSYLDYALLCPL